MYIYSTCVFYIHQELLNFKNASSLGKIECILTFLELKMLHLTKTRSSFLRVILKNRDLNPVNFYEYLFAEVF